jgi:hypothetical protein
MNRKTTLRKWGVMFWLLLWPTFWALHFYPIRNGQTRLALVGVPFLLWLGALILFRKSRAARWSCGLSAAFIFLILLLPGRAPDAETLRREYVQSLRAYDGVPYVWGGETRRGIDCSGLLRAAMIEANWRVGVRTFNPRLLRSAWEIWWHDSSAKALGDEYRGWTERLLVAENLNEANVSRLRPGDIAVTTGGQHCLAYLGNQTWIEADPNARYGDKVIQVQTPSKNAWFSLPMRLLRWRDLAGKP